ncbi:MAG: hypothetical protein ACYC2P_13355 [Paludibacteraceae bacterium]
MMLEGVRSIDLPAEVPVIIQATSDKAIELNRQQLYDRSEDKNSMALSLYKWQSYATFKNQMNPKPGLGRPDLFLTGSFQEKMFMEVEKETFNISSKDGKTFDLVKQYGDDIFGLSIKSKSEYAKTVWLGIKKYITAKSGLLFR